MNGVSARTSAVTVAGLAGTVASFVLLHKGFQAIGAGCAGTNPCHGLAATLLVGALGGLACLLVYSFSRPAAGPRLTMLAAPALLILTAWSFLARTGATLALGIVFGVAGLGLLLPLSRPRHLRAIFWNDGNVPDRLLPKLTKLPPHERHAVATNDLDHTAILRLRVLSATVHILALAAGLWIGNLTGNALLS